MTDLGKWIADFDRRLKDVERASRLSSASLDDTALEVRASDGGLRALVGQQADGTTAVNIVNGPTPPTPTLPAVASVLGGVTASWDGQFADGAVMPLDWSRIEVHASTSAMFTPDATTLRSTIETPQGAIVVIPTDDPVYVRLLARTTSGVASAATSAVGPMGPLPVVASDIVDGIVTEVKLANDAVTAAKIAAAAVGTTEIADDAVTTPKIIAGAVQAAQIAADAVNASKIAAGAITTAKLDALAVTADKLAANSVIAGKIAAGAVSTNQLTVGIAQSIVTKLTDAMGDATAWTQTIGSGTWAVITNVADAAAGGTVTEGTGPVSLERGDNIPYDPDALYKVTGRVRTTIAPSAGSPVVSIGLVGVAADGTTKVSSTGANNSVTGQHYIAAAGVTVPVGTAWSTFTGYVQGTAATGTTTACPDPKAPGKMHANVRYVRPSVRLLTGATGGTMQIDLVSVETVPTGVVNSVNIADGAITANKIAADAITGKTITGGTINGAEFHSNNGAGALVDILNGQITATAASGWKTVVDPTSTQPAFSFLNSVGALAGRLGATGTDSQPAVSLSSGLITDGAITDWRWVTYVGKGESSDFWRAYRVRDSDPLTVLGGWFQASNNRAYMAFVDTLTGSPSPLVEVRDGVANVINARLTVAPPASVNSAIFANVETSHTGNLFRLQNNGVDKFRVDKDGNTTIAGDLSVGGTTWTEWTPVVANAGTATWSLRTGWYKKIGKMVYVHAYIVFSAAGTGTGTVTVSLPSIPYRGPSANVRQLLSIWAGGIVPGTNSAVGGFAGGLIQPAGTTALIDQLRGPTDILLRGDNFAATATLTITGWYREA